MLNETIRKHIVNLYGLQGLRTGIHEVRPQDTFRVTSLWIADISFFNPLERLITGVIKTKDWSKGFIILDLLQEPNSRNYITPSRLIDVTNWQDPVRSALECVDVIKHESDFVSRGRGTYSYNLIVNTEAGYTQISFRGSSSTPSNRMRILWKSLLGAVYYLADEYDDPDVHQLVNPKRGLYTRYDKET